MPRYPRTLLAKGRSGWAEVCFRIESDGSTNDIKVVDASRRGDFDRAAIWAVSRYEYEPAKIDGKAVPFEDECVILSFYLDPSGGGSSWFRREYVAINELIDQERLEAAGQRIEAVKERGVSRPAEMKALYLTQVRYYQKLGDKHRALRALRMATWSGSLAKGESGANVGATLFAVYLELHAYRAALETYEELQERQATTPELSKVAEEVRKLVDGDGDVRVPAAILDHSGIEQACWRHKPIRRSLAIDRLEGRIDEVFVDCELRSASLKYEAEAVWKIPESWGECRLRVYGEVGSRFDLIEYGPAPEPIE